MYQGSMQEIMERYKQELYDYHQRSRNLNEEQVFVPPSARERGAVSSDAESVTVFSPMPKNPEPDSSYEAEPVPVLLREDTGLSALPADDLKAFVRPPAGFAPVPEGMENPMEENDAHAQEYEAFQKENPGMGTLKIQVSAVKDGAPLKGVSVTVSRVFGGTPHVFFSGMTDSQGMVPEIPLPAPRSEESQHPQEESPYATYDLFVSYPGYRSEEFKDLPVFDKEQSVQPVTMVLEEGEKLPPEVIVEEEPNL